MNRILLATLVAIPPCVSAQTLLSMAASNSRPGVGENVELTVSMKPEATNWCGLEVLFSDGEFREVRVDTVPLKLTKHFDTPGNQAVHVRGSYVRRGLKSALACLGDPQTLVVNVVDADKERQAQLAEARCKASDQEVARLRQEPPAAPPAAAIVAASPTPQAKTRPGKPGAAASGASRAASATRDESLKVF